MSLDPKLEREIGKMFPCFHLPDTHAEIVRKFYDLAIAVARTGDPESEAWRRSMVASLAKLRDARDSALRAMRAMDRVQVLSLSRSSSRMSENSDDDGGEL